MSKGEESRHRRHQFYRSLRGGAAGEAGHEVAVFHRGRTEAELPEGVGRVVGDRRNLGDFVGEFRRLAPEVVLDMTP